MDSKSMNPVIYFDELDKGSDTLKGGEIISILTHSQDTTVNSAFHDITSAFATFNSFSICT